VQLVTPFQAPPWFVYPFFGIGRVAKLFNLKAWLGWHRYSHYKALRWRLQALLPKTEPSIVYAQAAIAAKAALDLRALGYPVEVVMTTHFNGSEADEWVLRGYIKKGDRFDRSIRELEDQVLGDVDRVTFPSQFLADTLAQQSAGRKAQRWRVPNFVFEPPKGLGTSHSGDLITIGTLEPRKNQLFLIEVLAAAKRRGRNYRMTVVGDGVLRSSLEAAASALGVTENVTFAGFVPHAASLLHAHRAYVHSARIENCPIVVLEALASGRPVCAAPVGGIPELFDDGVEGVYWNLDDPETAADRLVWLLDDDEKYRNAARAARARYETSFAPGVVGPRLLEIVLGSVQTQDVA
jgi:glycosyltransferase involved in cell wall biosynthesis